MALLVLRLSALGDVIHTLPAVQLLRESFPGEEIAWAVEEPYRELVEIAAGARAIPLRMKKWGRSPLAFRGPIRETLRALRDHRAAVDFQGLLKSAMLGWVSRAPVRFGFAAGTVREKGALLFTNRRVEVDRTAHVVEQNLDLGEAAARALGAAGARRAGPESLEEPLRRFASDPEGRLDEYAGAIVLLPGAGKAGKTWPVDRFRALVRALGRRALVAWGPGARPLAEAIGGRIAPATGLRELARLVGFASVVIGGDTGPLHLAAASGTKVVGLYGPTDPRRNGPWGQPDRVIDRFQTTKSMESIAVEEVVRMLERLEAI